MTNTEIGLYFLFAEYLHENFDWHDNFDSGNIYLCKKTRVTHSERDVFNCWVKEYDL